MNTFSGLSSRIIRLNFHETNNATLTDLPCHGFRPQLPLPVGNTYRGTRNGIGSSQPSEWPTLMLTQKPPTTNIWLVELPSAFSRHILPLSGTGLPVPSNNIRRNALFMMFVLQFCSR
jgi:hypothetical protein